MEAPTVVPDQRRPRTARRLPGGLTLVVVTVLLLYFAFIFVLPLLQALWYSVNIYDILTGKSQFVGLRNYERLLADPKFWNGLRIAFIFTVATLALGLFLQVLLAAMFVTLRGVRKSIIVTLYFLPVILPSLAVVIVWQSMYRVDFGMFDVIARSLGLPSIPWLSNGVLALVAIIILTTWKALGYGGVIFMTGINEIPDELFEAAQMDGAGRVRQTVSISLPLLKPLFLLQIVASTIFLLQFIDPFYALTGGGPSGSTETLILYVYYTSFGRLNFSYGAAMTTVLFLVLLGASAVQLWLGRRQLGSDR